MDDWGDNSIMDDRLDPDRGGPYERALALWEADDALIWPWEYRALVERAIASRLPGEMSQMLKRRQGQMERATHYTSPSPPSAEPRGLEQEDDAEVSGVGRGSGSGDL
jgi:hypothetical protein